LSPCSHPDRTLCPPLSQVWSVSFRCRGSPYGPGFLYRNPFCTKIRGTRVSSNSPLDENMDLGACRIEEKGVQRIQLVRVLLIALMLGALIALVDASPGWDDTGVSAAMLLSASGLVGALHPARGCGRWPLACGYPCWASLYMGAPLPLRASFCLWRSPWEGPIQELSSGGGWTESTTPPKSVYEDSSSRRFLSHRALALRADSELSFGCHLRCMGLLPLLPSSLPSATADGFFSSAM
jgi:hypothetical protein